MTNALAHRGPDGEGSWYSEEGKLALGHRRLAIIDLSENGAQPMQYQEKYVITFNGEIYNYLELRIELSSKGYAFNTSSDTEVLLAAYDHWGINCLTQFDGMFAFALYDIVKDELFCARDRFGEKPFYYSFHEGSFYFSSEMKALWAAGVPRKPNMSLFYNYLALDLAENPNDQRETFFSGIFKLKAAHYTLFSSNYTIEQKPYWVLSTDSKLDISIEEAGRKLMALLETSVERRLRSDVKVGTSLSGGLDSSTIVALVSKQQTDNHTFSARFPGFAKDEGQFINLVSSTFKTKHHDVIVDEHELLPELDKLVYHQEEPFQTGSIFAQFAVYREARKNDVIVMLDGQGADEVLCGYDKDFQFYYRELVRSSGDRGTFIQRIKENHNCNLNLSSKEHLRIKFPNLYLAMAKMRSATSKKVPLGINPDFHSSFAPKKSPFYDPDDLKSMLKHELTNQGLEKLLRFADRNSMAHSVEVRLPFLYHELIEFVFKLNSYLFLNDGWSKAILRNGIRDTLPEPIVYRKDKVGFEAPHEKWTKANAFDKLYKDSKAALMKEGLMTEQYNQRFKTIIAAKYFNS
jgi:asparagine synthase (glutamine-hydrolysing)